MLKCIVEVVALLIPAQNIGLAISAWYGLLCCKDEQFTKKPSMSDSHYCYLEVVGP